nr:hydroxymethylglutaryl-CoA lyase, mitochondrial [Tanacetum cinerariifolium]
MPKNVKIVEVGPRDGLQNQKYIVPTSVKIELIQRLISCGLSVVEATSFVTPKWVPQAALLFVSLMYVSVCVEVYYYLYLITVVVIIKLADAKVVVEAVKNLEGASLLVLTPNLKGFEADIVAGAKEISVFAHVDEDKQSISTRVLAEVDKWLERFDCLVIGPRLVRDPFLLDCVSDIMKHARLSNVPMVIDGIWTCFIFPNMVSLQTNRFLKTLMMKENELWLRYFVHVLMTFDAAIEVDRILANYTRSLVSLIDICMKCLGEACATQSILQGKRELEMFKIGAESFVYAIMPHNSST